MMGNVVAKGKKEQVLQMYNALDDYYDKYLTSQSGTDEDYTITFEFSMKIQDFFYGDYFLDYSDDYECEIIAEMECDEDIGEDIGEEFITLHYNHGDMLIGISAYGIDPDMFEEY